MSTIKTASLADIPKMHMVRLAVRENPLTDPARITESSYVPFVEAGSAWVAVDHDLQILGFSALDPVTGSVWALFVRPDQEGVGVGRALHDIMLDWAREHGLRALWLFTATGTRAEQFYLTAGWRKKATTGVETRFEIILGG